MYQNHFRKLLWAKIPTHNSRKAVENFVGHIMESRTLYDKKRKPTETAAPKNVLDNPKKPLLLSYLMKKR